MTKLLKHWQKTYKCPCCGEWHRPLGYEFVFCAVREGFRDVLNDYYRVLSLPLKLLRLGVRALTNALRK